MAGGQFGRTRQSPERQNRGRGVGASQCRRGRAQSGDTAQAMVRSCRHAVCRTPPKVAPGTWLRDAVRDAAGRRRRARQRFVAPQPIPPPIMAFAAFCRSHPSGRRTRARLVAERAKSSRPKLPCGQGRINGGRPAPEGAGESVRGSRHPAPLPDATGPRLYCPRVRRPCRRPCSATAPSIRSIRPRTSPRPIRTSPSSPRSSLTASSTSCSVGPTLTLPWGTGFYLLKSSAMAANRRISSGASGCLRGRGGRAPASCSRLSRGSGRRLLAALLVAPLVGLYVDPGDPAAQPSVLLPGGYRASAGVALVRLLSAHRLAAVVLDEPLERIRDEPSAVVLMQVAVGFGAHPSPRYGNRRYPCRGAGYWRAIDRPRITEPPRGSRKGAR